MHGGGQVSVPKIKVDAFVIDGVREELCEECM